MEVKGEAVNTACYTQNRSIIVKRHGKTSYDVFRGRSPDINYFHVFGCPVHIHNHRDHLGKFNEDDESISQSIKGDAINFNENRSFLDDEFFKPKSKVSQCPRNTKYFPYIPAYENTTPSESPILQSAKKQSSVAMSSTGAEYVVTTRCCAQVLWIKSQLADYDVLYDKVPIFCDNTSAIAISNNPVLHSKIKHIDIRYHFIRDHILKGDIKLFFVPTDLQLADIFTKPLADPSFTKLVAELGMLNIETHVSDKKTDLSDL
uniref:Retrovirus-related Pol polyprotein from transposon TNT 1-94 n=1 Tax=Tanacetum cinerariifolium TaxID=118510 RepID=A0A6L2LCB8_TANCI|nr:retrovirus-related Pol polyprotein from transposon TNT 1-94 [Tanacetum cinerariifolium]